jgi:hypothetical protein
MRIKGQGVGGDNKKMGKIWNKKKNRKKHKKIRRKIKSI